MVWHEVGKFGVHSGRTLRSPSKPQRASPHSRAGYITKIVVNRTKPLDTDEIKRQLDNFRIADGFQNDLVVSETRFRNFEEEELWGRGFQSYDMVLSLNKKKRWLLPRLLREKITEDKEAFESEAPLDPRVVLIQRKSANIQDPDSFIRRLKKGDCHDVIDSSDKSCSSKRNTSRKRRKLCHVGDKYKRSQETVITYELCDNLSANSWPNYKETRSNSARLEFWYGDFRKRENKLKKMKMSKFCATDFDDLDVDYDFDDYEDDVDENLIKQSRHEFGLEAYVVDEASTKLSCKRHARKRCKSKAKPNQKVTENINPASSEKVHYYGKGFTKFIDPPDQDDENNSKEMTINPSASPAPPMNLELESHTLVKGFELSILTESLKTEDLQEKLKSRFKEGESIPRKFAISAPFCHHQYLLLEPYSNGKTNVNVSCKVRVTFICDDRQNFYPCESDPYTITNICNELAQLENQNGVLSINEVVGIFDSSCTCCVYCKASEKKSESKIQKSRMRKTVVAFDVFNSFNGHKTEVSSLMEATKEISAQCQNLNEAVTKNYDWSLLDCTKYPKTCEICFTESNESDEGVTFDSGGISIKPAKSMGQMKADMGGAATVCAALEAIALLKLPINITVLTPLCENMVSGNALKPGDVITASNGKTIEVENTDAEGRLILADALCYANSLSPSVIVDVATLTGAMDICLGQGAVGVFTNSLTLCHQLNQAGFDSGERMWRLPLYKHYREQIDSEVADLLNTGKTRSAGSCTAAMFLKEFVDCKHWAHLDIAGVMYHTDAVPYLGKGMSGRPTRALVELANRLSQYKLD